MTLSRYWTNSIGWQEDSSGGQSPEGFITQWGQGLSNPDIESGEFVIHSLAEPGTAYAYEIPINIEGSTKSAFGRSLGTAYAYEITINIKGSTKSAFGRSLGCIMIGFMPDEGLEEVLFSLRDMLEFYRHKPQPRPARLTRPPIDATIVNRRKRPDLILTE